MFVASFSHAAIQANIPANTCCNLCGRSIVFAYVGADFLDNRRRDETDNRRRIDGFFISLEG